MNRRYIIGFIDLLLPGGSYAGYIILFYSRQYRIQMIINALNLSKWEHS